MKKFALAFALVAAACGPTTQKAPDAAPPEASQAVTVVGLSITDATAKPPVDGQTTGVGFFTLRNTGDAPDKLIAASSPATSSIELHTHREVGGMKRMEKVDGVDAPAGAAVVFQPGGLHLMMFNFAPTGEEIPVTLTFEKAGEVVVPFKIVARSAGQGEAGHGMHEEHAH